MRPHAPIDKALAAIRGDLNDIASRAQLDAQVTTRRRGVVASMVCRLFDRFVDLSADFLLSGFFLK
jgi:hypothetical protein